MVVLIAGGAAGVGLAYELKHHTQLTAPPSTTTTASAPVSAGAPCPLTGAPAPGGTVPLRPALAIKVGNDPASRPWSGLDKADLVFEEPVEGGITRLVAVFQCQDGGQVGPIRSARAVDVPVLDQLSHPLFIHAGGIDPVISLLNAGNLVDDNVFFHGSIIVHPPGTYAPYSTYVTTTSGWGIDPSDTVAPAPLFTYAAAAPAGTAVTTVHIPFSGSSDVTWTWSATSQQWMMAYSGVPATVAGGNQIGVANVIVQKVVVTYGPWAENDQGGLEVQSKMTGTGPLEVFRNGQELSGTWQRATVGDSTTLVSATGTTIALAPGRTWVEIVPVAIAVTAH